MKETQSLQDKEKPESYGVIIFRNEQGYPLDGVNHYLVRLLGYQDKEEYITALQGHMLNAVVQRQRQWVTEQIQNQLTCGDYYSFECLLRGKDGSEIPISTYGTSVESSLGKVVTAVVKSVFEEQRNRRNEELIENLPAGVVIMKKTEDRPLHPIYCSESFYKLCRMTERDIEEHYSDSAYDGVHPDDRRWVQAALEGHENEESFYLPDYRLRTGDGDYIWVSVSFRLRKTEDNTRSFYAVYTDVTKEHLLSTQLADTQKRFTLALEHSNLFIWEYDLIHDRCINSEKAVKTFGVPRIMENYPECLFGTDTVDERTSRQYLSIKHRLKAGETNIREDMRLAQADGSIHWLTVEYKLEKDENGKPIRAIGFSYDITERKEMERKYKEQLAYRQSLTDNAMFSARLDLTEDKIIEYTNADEYFQQFLKHTTEASALLNDLYQGASEKIEGEYEDCYVLSKLIQSFQNGENQVHAAYRCTSIDKCIDVSVGLLSNPMNDHLEAFLVQQDVTREYLTQTALAAVIKKDYEYLGIIDVLSGSFVCLNKSVERHVPAPYCRSYEKEFQKIADIARPDFLTEKDYLAAHDDIGLKHVQKMLETQDEYGFNVSLKGENGEAVTYYVSYIYMNAQKTEILVTRADISKVVREEERKQQMLASALHAAEQASRAKSEFLSRMSHEIRTPMNAIIGITSLAASDISEPDIVSEDLSKIGMSARYLLSLINDILDMSRIESGRMVLNNGTIPFEEFISSVNNIINSQCEEKGIAYDAIVSGFVESAYIGDRVKLQQILVNILGNSVKFTSKGGKITLRIEQLHREAETAVMRFTINDTGAGIDEDFLPHIFNAFEQAEIGLTSSYGGTGLGLAICKSMVEMMDGHIDVHSIKGIGSEFVVELRLGVSEEAAKQAMLKNQAPLPTLYTLVVDDDITVCQSTQKTLERMGMRSEWSDSGIAAIELVRQRFAEQKNYDLILLDWKMPGMDGIETAREIRKIVGPEVTIIIMTAYDWSQIEKAARMAGVNMFMQKPLFQSTLMSAFYKIYGGETKKQRTVQKEYHFNDVHVLLVEDHPLNVEVARRLMEKQGIKVTVSNNGLEAIETFAQALPGTFDAILMDVRMPVMDGLTAAAHIRQMKKEGSNTIPIIAMTANAFDEDIRKSHDSGMDAHLGKPIDPQILYATLDKFINPMNGSDL